MTAVRESFALPGIFLSVTLLGGLRIADTVRLVPPPLIALVLGILLVAALARAGVVAPELFMNNRRTALDNVAGLVVLLSLFAASAQVFNLVTPDTGFLHAMFSVFFLVQLLTTMAAVRERVALLRGLLVLLGSAFLLRFVVLESLYSPAGGLVRRLTTTLMEGMTLGALGYTPHAPATGYVAFLTLALYMVGLVLLAPLPASQLPVRAFRWQPSERDELDRDLPAPRRAHDALER